MTTGAAKTNVSPRRRPRRCVACGAEEAKASLLRVVRSPDGVVSVSTSGKNPGRGAYVCAKLECVRSASKKNSLSRSLKQPVGSEIYRQLEELCVDGEK